MQLLIELAILNCFFHRLKKSKHRLNFEEVTSGLLNNPLRVNLLRVLVPT